MVHESAMRETESGEVESGLYTPPPEVVERAHVRDWQELAGLANGDPIAFWEERAEELEWYSP